MRFKEIAGKRDMFDVLKKQEIRITSHDSNNPIFATHNPIIRKTCP